MAGRVALAVGVTGRLGESLLEALVGAARYSVVHVATRAPLESALGKLHPFPLTLRSSGTAVPSPIDDVYCCIGLQPGFYGRDRAYATPNPADLPMLARLARAAGARRFALLAPLTPIDQLSAPAGGVRDTAELELVKAGFETLVLLRPADSGRPPAANLFERIAVGIAGVLAAYLIPQSMQPLRPDLVARAAIEALERAGPGTHVMNAPAIRALLDLKEPPRWLPRRK
jgi:hypothetical protein